MQYLAEESAARQIRGVVAQRSSDEVLSRVPVCLKSVRHVHLSAGRYEEPQGEKVLRLSWLISGRAMVAVGARRMPWVEGEMAVFLPSRGNKFWTQQSDNELCWMTLDGPLVEEFALHLGLRADVYRAGPPPMQQIVRLMESLKDQSPEGAWKASQAAIGVLYHVAQSMDAPELDQVVRLAQQKIQQEFSDPELTAESVAAKLNYHRGSLSRLFHKHTSMTIQEYITQTRLQRAKALLMHTDDKVAWIAEQCGFRETTYFCRWLRKHTGNTTRSLRVPTAR